MKKKIYTYFLAVLITALTVIAEVKALRKYKKFNNSGVIDDLKKYKNIIIALCLGATVISICFGWFYNSISEAVLFSVSFSFAVILGAIFILVIAKSFLGTANMVCGCYSRYGKKTAVVVVISIVSIILLFLNTWVFPLPTRLLIKNTPLAKFIPIDIYAFRIPNFTILGLTILLWGITLACAQLIIKPIALYYYKKKNQQKR